MDANPDCKYFIVSHMRGKLASMDAIKKLVWTPRAWSSWRTAPTGLGVLWNGGHSGHHGTMAAFSSQSYKMLNSGEGGFFVTDDDYAAARCMAYAGAYEALADKHFCSPCDAALAKVMDGSIPNFSLRMHEGTAAMLRPQIKTIGAPRGVQRALLPHRRSIERAAGLLRRGPAAPGYHCWGFGPVQRRG